MIPKESTAASYAELHCLSNFSFLRGASHPQELVQKAAELAYHAIAITDECSLSGIVRAHRASKEYGIKLICGAEFFLDEGIHLVLLAPSRQAYTELCSLISRARLHSEKGSYQLNLDDVRRYSQYCLAIWINPSETEQHVSKLKHYFTDRLWLAISLHKQQQAEPYYFKQYQLANHHQISMVACGNIHMHCRQRKPLQDVLSAIRLNTPLQDLGSQVDVNSERYLKPLSLLQRDYPADLLKESVAIAERCTFSLDELRYQYPNEVVPKHKSASDFLREITLHGAQRRWPSGVPELVKSLLEKELTLIAELGYEHYFLTVYDIVQFARNRGILCQGRGSAANSAVCYCLSITEVDPSRGQLLFERFISRERDEPPDIDVDFEHERREEVIQYIYKKYGRQHAALAATIISYRRRSAVRDVGKALGIDDYLLQKLSRNMAWWDDSSSFTQRLEETQFDTSSIAIQQFMSLLNDILGFPRHLSQHVGGFVITRDPIASLVPLENAAMPERTIIQWDKEDLEAMGLMKIDVLALGMLSALRKSLGYLRAAGSPIKQLSDIPAEDAATYQMLCTADSVGVFQIESRAQMTMLPRLQPRTFYDLVIQIAIVRPGPIQGGMVHPFLQRRQGLESIEYENDAIARVLKRTLGVPVFQEQVIQLAMVAADFSGGEADQLRRAMASWGKNGDLIKFRDKLVNGMRKRGYSEDFAERLFSQMKGFGAYGFPESHSASFALLAYASAWLKCHHPAAFYCGLLNSQPMGFYAPSQLIQDARRHNIDVRPICINHSDWDHTLEGGPASPALRLGLRLVKGFSQHSADQLCQARQKALFHSIDDFCSRLNMAKQYWQQLVQADAFHCFDLHRHQSLWEISAWQATTPLGDLQPAHSDNIQLPAPLETEEVLSDYRHTGLSLRRHPAALLRTHKAFKNCVPADQLKHIDDGRFIRLYGLVSCRQRPGTASGVMFLTLEDESGNSNIIVWPAVQERCKKALLQGRIIMVKGCVQKALTGNASPVIHIVAFSIESYDHLMSINSTSHDFH
ncbi:error-prone DNA polymerase [uncultured Zhongshania sp.]|jgi:error-prone DNA polymerase|uniref:error-prone DNA polymerase n=1 Tax=uncultured Zhongshania sp. TaxID=1642288 RepID=UPI0025FD54B3|nr:error-prone DNA polymerase [uncultured Zhongshania sp.]